MNYFKITKKLVFCPLKIEGPTSKTRRILFFVNSKKLLKIKNLGISNLFNLLFKGFFNCNIKPVYEISTSRISETSRGKCITTSKKYLVF